MNVQSTYPTTPDEFLRWNEGREGKREFVNGRVVEMMINVTRNHMEIATDVVSMLRGQLDRKDFSVGTADFAVRTPDGIRFPDVFVDRKVDCAAGSDLEAISPLVLIEILSSSSLARDFHDKMRDYKGVPSLLYYMILAYDEPRAWMTARFGDGWSETEQFAGQNEILFLPEFGGSLPMSDIYDGVQVSSLQ